MSARQNSRPKEVKIKRRFLAEAGRPGRDDDPTADQNPLMLVEQDGQPERDIHVISEAGSKREEYSKAVTAMSQIRLQPIPNDYSMKVLQ